MAATAAGEVFQLTKPTATFLTRTRGELLALVATASSSGSWWPIYPHCGCRRPGEHLPLGELAAFLELAYEALPGHGLAALAVVQPHLFTSEIFDGIMGGGYWNMAVHLTPTLIPVALHPPPPPPLTHQASSPNPTPTPPTNTLSR